jgi:predicted nucleotidyltransferase
MNNVPTFDEVCKAVNKRPEFIKGCYIFGSRVYGTASENSDWDIILVANASSPDVEYNVDKFNIHIIVPDLFEKLVRDNHIKAIECIFAPEWAQLKPYPIEFVFKPDSFRHNISHTVSNSWVKSKKKLTQGDYYIGIKSIYHSLRIASFGIQFAVHRDIVFSTMNWMWDDLNNRTWTWEELQEKYQPIRNNLLTNFRTLCEK